MSLLAQRRERSVAQLDKFLTARYGGERLNNDDLVEAGLFGNLAHAWKVRPGATTPIPQLLLGVDGRYPLTLPRVLLPKPAQWHLRIPHVSREGIVCVLPEQATGDARQIGEVADHMIRRAVTAIEDGISGKNRADFLAEAESYWAGAASNGATPVWSLIKPAPPSREISCVECQGFLVAGNSPEECRRWMRNYALFVPRSITSGVFVWTKRGIFPDDYFKSNGELLAFLAADDPGLLAKLSKLADGKRSRIPVVIAMPTLNGPALLSVSLNDFARKPSAKLNGFGPAHSLRPFSPNALNATRSLDRSCGAFTLSGFTVVAARRGCRPSRRKRSLSSAAGRSALRWLTSREGRPSKVGAGRW